MIIKQNAFSDIQRPKDRVFSYILILSGLIILSATIVIMLQSENNPIVYIPLIGSFFLIVGLYRYMKLIITINKEGIFYQYRPFHFSAKKIDWTDVKEYQIIEINPMKDFGGFGIKYTANKKGYIINKGPALEIIKANDKTIVVNISDKEDVEKAIANFRPSPNS